MKSKELLEIIQKYPNHEIMFLVSGEESSNWWTSIADIEDIQVGKYGLYNDEIWLDEEDYEDRLYCDLEDYYNKYDDLKEAVERKMAEADFREFIAVYLAF